jgi:hypothetical protein
LYTIHCTNLTGSTISLHLDRFDLVDASTATRPVSWGRIRLLFRP